MALSAQKRMELQHLDSESISQNDTASLTFIHPIHAKNLPDRITVYCDDCNKSRIINSRDTDVVHIDLERWTCKEVSTCFYGAYNLLNDFLCTS